MSLGRKIVDFAKYYNNPDFKKLNKLSGSLNMRRLGLTRRTDDIPRFGDWESFPIDELLSSKINKNRGVIASALGIDPKGEAFILCDEQGCITYASRKFKQIFGFTGGVQGKTFSPNISLPGNSQRARKINELNPGEAYCGRSSVDVFSGDNDKKEMQVEVIAGRIQGNIGGLLNPIIVDFRPLDSYLLRRTFNKIDKINDKLSQRDVRLRFEQMIHSIKHILFGIGHILAKYPNNGNIKNAIRIVRFFGSKSLNYLNLVRSVSTGDRLEKDGNQHIVLLLNTLANSVIKGGERIMSLIWHEISNDDKSILQGRLNEILRILESFGKASPKRVFRIRKALHAIAYFHNTKSRGLNSGVSVISDTESLPNGIKYTEGSDLDLKRILDDLITNSIKFSKSGDKITIKAESYKDGFMTFSVSDEGPGIPDGSKEDIFTLGTSHSGSTGIGLSSVKRLVESYGGNISFENNINFGGKGVTFRFTFPLDQIHGYLGKDEMIKSLTIKDTVGKVSKEEDFKILLVEDSPEGQMITKMFLRGYTVDIASSAKEAISMLNQGGYHLVLMDNDFGSTENPRSAGGAVLTGVIKSKKPNMYILGISANDQGSIVYEEFKKSGIDGFISKGQGYTRDSLRSKIDPIFQSVRVKN